MEDSLYYQIALTLVPGIGCVQARNLLEKMDAETIFKEKKSKLEKIEGIGTIRAGNIKNFSDFDRVEMEISFLEKYKINALFLKNPDYPQRLLNCYDAPVMLYYRGNADLNQSKIIAMVGSRTHTEYGKQVTENLVKELSTHGVLVVSGLAYGIDSVAHKAALKNSVETVGVLAHGLDKIYPALHTDLAKAMLKSGGLLTEFKTKTKPDKHNFPSRNRIVAGMSDATIVIETDVKGGSMITAELAGGYNRDVFAIPGKITDKKSGGCNYLIANNKAELLVGSTQFLESMGWVDKPKSQKEKLKELFINLTHDESQIVALINEKGSVSIDEINMQCAISSSAIAAAILNLEMQQIIRSLPGKIYQLS